MGAILLDFDHTLFDTDRFFWQDLRKFLNTFGFPNKLLKESYDRFWSTGYSLRKHLNWLTGKGKILPPFLRNRFRKEIENFLQDLNPWLFPDVLPFLRSMRKKGFRLILLSFGDPSWQKLKVERSGLDAFLDEIIYTRKEVSKSEYVQSFSTLYSTLVMIDNDPRELDSAVRVCPTLLTFWITRIQPTKTSRYQEARKYLRMKPFYPHQRISSLKEIQL